MVQEVRYNLTFERMYPHTSSITFVLVVNMLRKKNNQQLPKLYKGVLLYLCDY